MQTFNQINVMGYLAKDAEVISFAGGGQKTVLIITTNTGFGDNENTQFHRAILKNKASEITSRLKKGDVVLANGQMEYRKWNDAEGKTHITPEIIVSEFSIIKGEVGRVSTNDTGITQAIESVKVIPQIEVSSPAIIEQPQSYQDEKRSSYGKQRVGMQDEVDEVLNGFPNSPYSNV